MIDAPAQRQLMVIDDEDSVRSLVRTIFEADGWTVTEVSGGAQALGLLREPPFPDVVLLDLIMPGVDGLAVLSELRGERRIWNLPVVVLSDTGGPLGARLAASLGAESCITKPFDPATLLSRCAALAGRAHADDGVVVRLPEVATVTITP